MSETEKCAIIRLKSKHTNMGQEILKDYVEVRGKTLKECKKIYDKVR